MSSSSSSLAGTPVSKLVAASPSQVHSLASPLKQPLWWLPPPDLRGASVDNLAWRQAVAVAAERGLVEGSAVDIVTSMAMRLREPRCEGLERLWAADLIAEVASLLRGRPFMARSPAGWTPTSPPVAAVSPAVARLPSSVLVRCSSSRTPLPAVAFRTETSPRRELSPRTETIPRLASSPSLVRCSPSRTQLQTVAFRSETSPRSQSRQVQMVPGAVAEPIAGTALLATTVALQTPPRADQAAREIGPDFRVAESCPQTPDIAPSTWEFQHEAGAVAAAACSLARKAQSGEVARAELINAAVLQDLRRAREALGEVISVLDPPEVLPNVGNFLAVNHASPFGELRSARTGDSTCSQNASTPGRSTARRCAGPPINAERRNCAPPSAWSPSADCDASSKLSARPESPRSPVRTMQLPERTGSPRSQASGGTPQSLRCRSGMEASPLTSARTSAVDQSTLENPPWVPAGKAIRAKPSP